MSKPLRAWARMRDRLRDRPVADFCYRIAVGAVGLVVLFVGVLAIPYPGPGWAIVFVGLAILATEFEWAHRALKYTRARYDKAMEWVRAQSWWVQAAGAVLTAAFVIATLWLFGAIGWAAALLGLDYPVLRSPIGFGS